MFGTMKRISEDNTVAKSRRVAIDQGQDFECVLLALSNKSKLLLRSWQTGLEKVKHLPGQ